MKHFRHQKCAGKEVRFMEPLSKKHDPISNKKYVTCFCIGFSSDVFFERSPPPNFFLPVLICAWQFFINVRQCWLSIFKGATKSILFTFHFFNVGPPNGEHLFTTIYGLYCSQNCYITYLCRITVYFMLGITIVTHYLDLESRRLRNTILCHSVKCKY